MIFAKPLWLPLGNGYYAFQEPITPEGCSWSLVRGDTRWGKVTVGFRIRFVKETFKALELLQQIAADHQHKRGTWKPSGR